MSQCRYRYRKAFTVGELAGGDAATAAAIGSGMRVLITFDGVYMDSTTWLDGKPLGEHPYGYTTYTYLQREPNLQSSPEPADQEVDRSHSRCRYEVGALLRGSANDARHSLAVKVDNSGSNSRWFSGELLCYAVVAAMLA